MVKPALNVAVSAGRGASLQMGTLKGEQGWLGCPYSIWELLKGEQDWLGCSYHIGKVLKGGALPTGMPLSYMGSAYSGAGLAGMPLSYTGSSRVLSRSQLPSPRVGAASALLPLPVNVTKNIGTAPSKLGQEDNKSFFFFFLLSTLVCVQGP